MSEPKDDVAEVARRWRSRTLSAEEVLTASDRIERDRELQEALADDELAAAAAAAVDRQLEEARGAMRHLDGDQLERWVDGHADAAEAELVRRHLALCPTCREEAADLTVFARELSAAAARSRLLRWSVPAAAGLVAAFGLALHFQAAPGPQPKPAAAVVAPAPAAAPDTSGPALPILLRDGPLELRVSRDGTVTGVPEAWRDEISALVRDPELALPAAAVAVARGPERQRGAPGAAEHEVELQSPRSEVVLEDRPTFRWRGPAGVKYRVEVYDARFARVAASDDVAGTAWRPSVPLPRGELLTWTLAVERPDGSTSTFPLAPAAPAVFEVGDAEAAAAVELARASGSRLLAGLALWRAGRVEEAARELDRLARENSGSTLARRLAESSGRGASRLRAATSP